MPEADAQVLLPGIDDVAPSSGSADAPAAPQPAAEPSTDSAAVDVGDASPPAEPAASEPTPADGTPPKRGPQERFDELTRARREAERETQGLRDMNARLLTLLERGAIDPRQVQREMAGQPELREPQRKDFDSYEAYMDARSDYRADVRVMNALRNFAQQSAQARRNAAVQRDGQETQRVVGEAFGNMTENVRKGFDRYPDLPEIIAKSTKMIPPNVQLAMTQSADPAAVTHYLLTNEAVIDRLSRLNPFQIGAAMDRISRAAIGASASISNAPPPGKPAGSRGGAPMGYREDFTPEEHIAWEKRRDAAAASGR